MTRQQLLLVIGLVIIGGTLYGIAIGLMFGARF